MNLKECLRKAVDIVFTPTGDITDDNVQDAIGAAYDRGTEALNAIGESLDRDTADTLYLGINATSDNSTLLENNNANFYRNASNLNAGITPNARLPNTATRTDNDIKDIAGTLAGGSQTRIDVTYNASNRTYTFVASKQTDNNFTNAYKAQLDSLPTEGWQVVSSSTTLSAGDRVLVDMKSIANITITLPASPQAGHIVIVGDGRGEAGNRKTLTIAGNSTRIMSLNEDMTVDIPGYLMTFVYLNSTRGWVVFN